jgi:plastocyanin domain-containing protein
MRRIFGSMVTIAVLGAAAACPAEAAAKRGRGFQSTTITVTGEGYSPVTIRLRRNVPARITFIRTSDVTCGAEVVFPSLGIRRELPLNTPVVIRFTPRKSGRLSFVCGMDMWHGAVVVR